MMVLKRKDWLFMQRSTLTYSVDHTVLESRVNAHRLFPCRGLEISYLHDYKIKVEILNIQINRSRTQSQMALVKYL